MSFEELKLWFNHLPKEGKWFYTKTYQLDEHNPPWDAYLKYKDLDQRVYRPFNPETMNWTEYCETSDYLVYLHHMNKREISKLSKRDHDLNPLNIAVAGPFSFLAPNVASGDSKLSKRDDDLDQLSIAVHPFSFLAPNVASDDMSVSDDEDVMEMQCEGCKYDEPSQRWHSCLGN